MAAGDQKIKVIFDKVTVLNDSDPLGDGEFYFIATVDGLPVGNRRQIFNAQAGRDIILGWEAEVDVKNKRRVAIRFEGKEEDIFSDDNLGIINLGLNRPYFQLRLVRQTRYFELHFRIELLARGRYGRHTPNRVFATRQVPGAVAATTVSGAALRARMEMHSVLPVPTAAASLPRRPAALSGVPWPAVGAALPSPPGPTTPTATSAMNVIANPAVIPILGPPNSAPAGAHSNRALDHANWVNPRNAARIECTYYQPRSLAFGADDDRLTWSVVSVAGGGAVSFLKSDGTTSNSESGTKAMVYGTSAGEVRLEVRFKGAIISTYRALVLNIRQVPCRCNILNGPTGGSQPRVNPQDVRNHIDIANRTLRQLGVELTLDTNNTPRRGHGARATNFPGIFRISVPRGRTRRVRNTAWATRRNYRNNVMNFVYIHSDWTGRDANGVPNPSNLGAATDYPASNAGATITDPPLGAAAATANPSTSWIRPTGVGVGADATPVQQSMTLLTANQRMTRRGVLTDPQLFCMYVCDSNGGPRAVNHRTAARQLTYANTMAHEFGHILNLGHRVEGVAATRMDMVAGAAMNTLSANGIFWDGMLHPLRENVMHWSAPSSIAQDFDIIQARAVQQSPLVVAAPMMAPAVRNP